MSNLVLYRKYRPKTFSEIIGQEHIVQTITNAISSRMISHAYLFSGPRGSGKTTIARLIAKSVNCLDRRENEYEPCNRCENCKEINEARSIDLIEIDAASNRGVDEIRELKDGIKFAPTKSKYKVFIIDEAHQLTKEAANALLKTLEEPPVHAIFILATTEIHRMLPTIISRCQRFDFRKLSLPEILKKLELICKRENAKIEKNALKLIALNSQGSIRDAESLLDQVLTFAEGSKGEIKSEEIKDLLGLVDIGLVSQLVDFLCEKKSDEAINFLNKTLEKGYDPYEFIKVLINYLRKILLFKISPETLNLEIFGLTKEDQKKLQAQVEKFKEEEIRQSLKLFLEAANKMKFSPIPQLPLEIAIIEVIGLKE